MELKDCFRLDYLKDCFRLDYYLTEIGQPNKQMIFSEWLLTSNNPKILKRNTDIASREDHEYMLDQIEKESLQQILDILIREPLADYFWYGYTENDGRLTFTIPSDGPGPVPGDALRVDKEKIKVFLRDYKLTQIGL
jgi:hypothetical protein